MTRILVTGCGRSGTQFIAKVLSFCGLRCRHERVYGADSVEYNRDKLGMLFDCRWRDHDAECSWLAAPYLDTLPEDVVVWHQLRHPLKILRCWVGHRLVIRTSEAAGRFISHHLPECLPPATEFPEAELAIRYVLRWHEMIEDWGRAHADRYQRYRVEALGSVFLGSLLLSAGYPNRYTEAQEALAGAVPKDVGSCHHGPGDEMTWAMLRGCPSLPALREQAHRHGYED